MVGGIFSIFFKIVYYGYFAFLVHNIFYKIEDRFFSTQEKMNAD